MKVKASRSASSASFVRCTLLVAHYQAAFKIAAHLEDDSKENDRKLKLCNCIRWQYRFNLGSNTDRPRRAHMDHGSIICNSVGFQRDLPFIRCAIRPVAVHTQLPHVCLSSRSIYCLLSFHQQFIYTSAFFIRLPKSIKKNTEK